MWQVALSSWRMILVRLFVFIISPKTSGEQMVVYHSEWIVLRSFRGTVATRCFNSHPVHTYSWYKYIDALQLYFLNNCLHQATQTLFWHFVIFCGIQWEQTFSTVKMSNFLVERSDSTSNIQWCKGSKYYPSYLTSFIMTNYEYSKSIFHIRPVHAEYYFVTYKRNLSTN